jgi:hypothetical protein
LRVDALTSADEAAHALEVAAARGGVDRRHLARPLPRVSIFTERS